MTAGLFVGGIAFTTAGLLIAGSSDRATVTLEPGVASIVPRSGTAVLDRAGPGSPSGLTLTVRF